MKNVFYYFNPFNSTLCKSYWLRIFKKEKKLYEIKNQMNLINKFLQLYKVKYF